MLQILSGLVKFQGNESGVVLAIVRRGSRVFPPRAFFNHSTRQILTPPSSAAAVNLHALPIARRRHARLCAITGGLDDVPFG
jgi:uncharacterized membrane protein YagU involved in acid resistance